MTTIEVLYSSALVQLLVGWSADGSPWSHPGGDWSLQEGHKPQEDELGSGSLQGWSRKAFCPQLCSQGRSTSILNYQMQSVCVCVTYMHRYVCVLHTYTYTHHCQLMERRMFYASFSLPSSRQRLSLQLNSWIRSTFPLVVWLNSVKPVLSWLLVPKMRFWKVAE